MENLFLKEFTKVFFSFQSTSIILYKESAKKGSLIL